MHRKKILNGGKSYYIHPIFTNYAASKDGEILNVKTGRILKKNWLIRVTISLESVIKMYPNQRITIFTGLNGNV